MLSFETDGFNAIRVVMMVILSSHSVIQATQVFWRVVIFLTFLTQVVAHSVLRERSRVRFPERESLEFYNISIIIIYKLVQFCSCIYTSYIVNSLAMAGSQFPLGTGKLGIPVRCSVSTIRELPTPLKQER